ncbi:glutathione S-transferase family protein [Pelagibius sp. Alg239-R121]|uniref:glutathione S-transferase family protein n=1 Tax=Pelagibius sp. Alg239-R121 TaxID=2993448 RepID=UPI0024A73C64|nr:glutathione S-transferase family protein [Pelagibius sp. Alg239-R121]
MAALELIIGNKNYSSWSFRPWIAMKVKEVEFKETLSLFDEATDQAHFLEFSPTKKVPVLKDGETTIWESLAILEYLADLFPGLDFWPKERIARAQARSISSEMHAGFGALRIECSMNMRREVRAIDVSDAARKDVARIEAIWQGCLDSSGGPFLFGDFCNADAMFAPVVNRLHRYELSRADAVTKYSEAMTALPAWQEWEAAGKAEPWIVEADEA